METAEGAYEFQQQLAEYVSHFAGCLLTARAATDQHIIAFRNYALAIGLYAKAETGTIHLISKQHINELYNTGLQKAHAENIRPDAREVATLQLAPSTSTWQRYYRTIRSYLRPEVGTATDPREILGGLATGRLTYADISGYLSEV